MKRWYLLATWLLVSGGVGMWADDRITVEATREDISEGLDLKSVATLFGEVKDLSELEQKLNLDSLHINNLDLNGDGEVDYLRVIEMEDGKKRHLVVIQAVLAEDIYQDIATIYVEKKSGKDVSVQVIGDAYIYGKNYVIEPVYIYRPVIYDWFWGPSWVCYNSPWYWGYWPGWYTPYPCWGHHDYWVHVHVYHYDHPRCSYRYASEPHYQATQMRDPVSRSDYARSHSTSTFTNRTGMSNAREYSNSRRTTSSPVRVSSSTSSSTRASSSSSTRVSSSSSVSRSVSSTPSMSSGSSSYRSASSSSYRTPSTYSSSSSGSRTSSYSSSSSSSGRSSSSSYSGSSSSRSASSSMSSGGSSGRR